MSCRLLVVALLASSSALADLSPERESDTAARDGGSAAPVSDPGIIEPGARGAGTDGPRHQGERTPGPAVTSPEPRWNVDLDTVLGSFSGLQATSLATARWRPLGRLSLGVTVPFLIGGGRPPDEGCGGPAWCNRPPPTSRPIQSLGNVGVSAAWETRLGPRTRLPVGLLLALPTALGEWYLEGAAAMTRGLEDGELFAHASFAIVPSVGVLQELGGVAELSASARLPVVPSDRGPLLNGVATVQFMLKVLAEPRRPQVFIGVRGTGAFRTWPYSAYWWGANQEQVYFERAWSIAFGPRLEARIGPVQLHLGFLVAFHSVPAPVENPVPGMSLGAGASF